MSFIFRSLLLSTFIFSGPALALMEENCTYADNLKDLSRVGDELKRKDGSCSKPLTDEDQKILAQMMQALRDGKMTEEKVLKDFFPKLSPAGQVEFFITKTKLEEERMKGLLDREPKITDAFTGVQQTTKKFIEERNKFLGKPWKDEEQAKAVKEATAKTIDEIMRSKMSHDDKMKLTRFVREVEISTFAQASQRYQEIDRRAAMGEAIAKTTAHLSATAALAIGTVVLGPASANLAAGTGAAAFTNAYMLVKVAGDAALSKEPLGCALSREYSNQLPDILMANVIALGFGTGSTAVIGRLAPAVAVKVTQALVVGGTAVGVGATTLSVMKAREEVNLAREALARGDEAKAEAHFTEANKQYFHAVLDGASTATGIGGARKLFAKDAEGAALRAKRMLNLDHSKELTPELRQAARVRDAFKGKALGPDELHEFNLVLQRKLSSAEIKGLKEFSEGSTVVDDLLLRNPKKAYFDFVEAQTQALKEAGFSGDEIAKLKALRYEALLENHFSSRALLRELGISSDSEKSFAAGVFSNSRSPKSEAALTEYVSGQLSLMRRGNFSDEEIVALVSAEKPELVSRFQTAMKAMTIQNNATPSQAEKVIGRNLLGTEASDLKAVQELGQRAPKGDELKLSSDEFRRIRYEEMKKAMGLSTLNQREQQLMTVSLDRSMADEALSLNQSSRGILSKFGKDIESTDVVNMVQLGTRTKGDDSVEVYERSLHMLKKYHFTEQEAREAIFMMDKGHDNVVKAATSDNPIARALANSKLGDVNRLAYTEKVLQRSLSEGERHALLKAHRVGDGQKGLDGTKASIFNYTESQIKTKLKILKDAGFNPEERRLLMDDGLAGKAPGK